MFKRKRKHNDIISRVYAMLHIELVGFPIVVIFIVRCAIWAPPASFHLTTYLRTAGILLCQTVNRTVPRRLAFSQKIYFDERF